MLEASKIRNLSLPTIKQEEYATLGRIIAKRFNRAGESATEQDLKSIDYQLLMSIKNILSSPELSYSYISNKTIPSVSTTNKTTGLLGETSNKYLGHGNHQLGTGMGGMIGEYTNSYKPVSDKKKPRPYDSVWSMFF